MFKEYGWHWVFSFCGGWRGEEKVLSYGNFIDIYVFLLSVSIPVASISGGHCADTQLNYF